MTTRADVRRHGIITDIQRIIFVDLIFRDVARYRIDWALAYHLHVFQALLADFQLINNRDHYDILSFHQTGSSSLGFGDLDGQHRTAVIILGVSRGRGC